MSKNTITNIVTPNLDQLTPLVDSRYTLVTLAAKRARDIMDNSQLLRIEPLPVM